MEDPYQVLQLNFAESPSDHQIRTAYRKLALKFHPDRNKAANAKEMFEKVKQASVILLDPSLRKQYDLVYKARQEALLRREAAGKERKRFLDDLERREKDLQNSVQKTYA